jgi:hypothetical protein
MTTTSTTTTSDGLKRGVLALLAMTGIAGGVLLALGAAEKKKGTTALARSSNPVDVATRRAEALIRAARELPDGISPRYFEPIQRAIEDVRAATKHREEALRDLKKRHKDLLRFIKDNWTSDEIARIDWSGTT